MNVFHCFLLQFLVEALLLSRTRLKTNNVATKDEGMYNVFSFTLAFETCFFFSRVVCTILLNKINFSFSFNWFFSKSTWEVEGKGLRNFACSISVIVNTCLPEVQKLSSEWCSIYLKLSFLFQFVCNSVVIGGTFHEIVSEIGRERTFFVEAKYMRFQ